MMLRSSSTPLLGSLISSSSYSESPNQNYSYDTNSTIKHHHHYPQATIPFHQSPHLNITSSTTSKGIRRAQSEGNLQGLSYNGIEQLCHLDQFAHKFHAKPENLLQTIPSFSFYGLKGMPEQEEEEESEFDNEDEREDVLDNGFMVSNEATHFVAEEKRVVKDGNWETSFENEREVVSQEMFIARELEIGGGGGFGGGRSVGGHGEFNSGGDDERDNKGVEDYYKNMVQENPGNTLFLRNYAQFLHQNKGDLQGAEEYFSRAILADPSDGDTMSRYAQLVWELHKDQDRALSYFERAVQASPNDSHVHAAYASFLWDIEEDGNECGITTDFDDAIPDFSGVMTTAGA